MASLVALLPTPVQQFFDNNGAPLGSGKIYTYASDGATPKATYTEPTGTTLNPNPIILDGAGRATIFGKGNYIWQLQDSLGNTIWNKPTADAFSSFNATDVGIAMLQFASTAAILGYLNGQTSGASGLPYGTFVPYGGATAPTGWVFCYGQQIGRTQYPGLFTAIGTTWGAGDGFTTFNVPDLRGRTVFGVDAMGGTAANRLTTASITVAAVLGVVAGSELLQDHGHTINDPGHTHLLNSVADNTGYTSGFNLGTSPTGVGLHNNPTASSVTGITLNGTGGGENQNIPPMAVGNWIIQLG